MKKLVIFDLDGTLVDSLEDIFHAVNASFKHLNLPQVSLEYVKKSIGDGARKLIERCLPEDSQHLLEEAFAFFLPYYTENCAQDTCLYDGVLTALEILQEKGIAMAVLTNKPIVPTQKILAELEIEHFFSRIYGGDSFAEPKPSPMGIQTILQELSIPAENALMVGDGTPDVLSAQNAGVDVIAILNGIGKSEELLALNPTYTAKTFSDIWNRLPEGAFNS